MHERLRRPGAAQATAGSRISEPTTFQPQRATANRQEAATGEANISDAGKAPVTGRTVHGDHHDFSRIPLSSAVAVPESIGVLAKLVIGGAGDRHELEADAVAEQVMRMPDGATERHPGEPRADAPGPNTGEQPRIHRRANADGGADAVASDFTSSLDAGVPLDDASRAYFEPRFGHDFGTVRVHSGKEAGALAAGIHARAFTLGQDVVFAPKEHSPASALGKRLLAHELAHVVQQSPSGARRTTQAVDPSSDSVLQRAPTGNKDEGPSTGPASPYPEEEAVLRAGVGARDSRGLADGVVLYSAKGWEAVGLSEAAFAAGPFTSDMGTIFYVYRLESTDSTKATQTVSRGVYLGNWGAKITPELRDELAKVKVGKTVQIATTGPMGATRGTAPQPPAKQSAATTGTAIRDHRTAPSLSPVWIPPTEGVVQAWMYNQVDNWHTGALQGLSNFKDAVKGATSVGFWLGLGGNVTWALGSFGAPPVAVTVGLIGIAIGTFGSVVQTHADKSESDRVDAIYQDLLKGFNDSRSQMNLEIIQDTNAIVVTDEFKKAVATKSTAAWQAVVRKQANMPEGQDIDQVSKNTERNLYDMYLKDRGSYYTRDIFNVETPNHPGFEGEEKNVWLHNVPDKVRDRLTAIGVDWKRIHELPIPHRDRQLYRKSGTVGAIEYWDYDESTVYPPSWTRNDIAEFLKKAPSYVGETRTGTTH